MFTYFEKHNYVGISRGDDHMEISLYCAHIYIIKEKLETWSSMESYLPTSDRHAASWIFSDGPSKPLGVVKLRYNALKLFFFIMSLFYGPVSTSDSQKSWILTSHTSGHLSDKVWELASAHNDRPPVILTEEEDVPGASLTYAQLERHSVEQLRRWLVCRGMKRSGNKSALLQR